MPEVTGMTEAVRVAAQLGRRQPWSFLGAPAVLSASATGIGMAAVLKPEGNAPETGYHLHKEPSAQVATAIQAVPRSIPQPLDLGSVSEAGLLLAFVLVLAPDRVWVWILDGNRKVLAWMGGLIPLG